MFVAGTACGITCIMRCSDVVCHAAVIVVVIFNRGQFFQDGMQTFIILMLPWVSTFPQVRVTRYGAIMVRICLPSI